MLKHDADAFRQEIYLRDLNLEFTNIELAESVKSAQVATAALYKDRQEFKLAEITLPTPPNRLTSFFSSTRTQKQKLRSQTEQQEVDESRASVKYMKNKNYCDQGEPRNSD